MTRGRKRLATSAEKNVDQRRGGRRRRSTTKAKKAGREALIDLPNLVTLIHSHLAPLLAPQDANNLLLRCSQSLKQDVRDAIATEALLIYYKKNSAHFGLKCHGDWHHLIPRSAQGARGRCACNWDRITATEVVPSELPLPKMLDARAHLLGAMCLLYKGIQPHCFKVLQMFRGGGYFEAATMQPIVFSLVEGLEKECGVGTENTVPIDPENTTMLSRLLDIVLPGFGVEFFSARNARRSPAHVLEAHWRGIAVDLETGATSCQFCERYAQSPLFRRVRGIPMEQNDAQLRTHCSAVYQPLKEFMLQHLTHVRYVRPPRGWNYEPSRGHELLDLIAGFTSAGVLCGVYVTDSGVPSGWIRSRLAPGHFGYPRSSGVTGLHRAVSEGDVEIVQLLLAYGADVNQRSTWGWYAPLHLACKTGSEEMIWLLLNHGANWNLADKVGRRSMDPSLVPPPHGISGCQAKKTPLQWAVRAGKASVAYRIDQQLHAKAKLALQQAREQQQQNTTNSSLTFAKLCG
ncbi:hypothetical protein ON010_g10900 [Phytophthora cinnamomi]|nr:hypothetical protein ON010_g10900 [Phytophthora cinnamomi]